jgi:RNA polymerase sigma-70 factor (ECF subfamily)
MEIVHEGENAAFESVYRRHVDTIYRLCFSYLKNRTDTEDAVQSTFLKLLGANKSFRSEEHEKAWLIVVASNICKNALRHWWRKRSDIDSCAPMAAPEENDMREIYEAILALPPRCKTVVYLYYYEGYSTQEMAAMLNKPISTIRNQLSDARKVLKKKLEETGNAC